METWHRTVRSVGEEDSQRPRNPLIVAFSAKRGKRCKSLARGVFNVCLGGRFRASGGGPKLGVSRRNPSSAPCAKERCSCLILPAWRTDAYGFPGTMGNALPAALFSSARDVVACSMLDDLRRSSGRATVWRFTCPSAGQPSRLEPLCERDSHVWTHCFDFHVDEFISPCRMRTAPRSP